MSLSLDIGIVCSVATNRVSRRGPNIETGSSTERQQHRGLSPTHRNDMLESGFPSRRGPVAQLGARMNGIHEVTGSIPVWSTNLRS